MLRLFFAKKYFRVNGLIWRVEESRAKPWRDSAPSADHASLLKSRDDLYVSLRPLVERRDFRCMSPRPVKSRIEMIAKNASSHRMRPRPVELLFFGFAALLQVGCGLKTGAFLSTSGSSSRPDKSSERRPPQSADLDEQSTNKDPSVADDYLADENCLADEDCLEKQDCLADEDCRAACLADLPYRTRRGLPGEFDTEDLMRTLLLSKASRGRGTSARLDEDDGSTSAGSSSPGDSSVEEEELSDASTLVGVPAHEEEQVDDHGSGINDENDPHSSSRDRKQGPPFFPGSWIENRAPHSSSRDHEEHDSQNSDHGEETSQRATTLSPSTTTGTTWRVWHPGAECRVQRLLNAEIRQLTESEGAGGRGTNAVDVLRSEARRRMLAEEQSPDDQSMSDGSHGRTTSAVGDEDEIFSPAVAAIFAEGRMRSSSPPRRTSRTPSSSTPISVKTAASLAERFNAFMAGGSSSAQQDSRNTIDRRGAKPKNYIKEKAHLFVEIYAFNGLAIAVAATLGGVLRECGQEVARRALPSIFPKLARAMWASCVRTFSPGSAVGPELCALVSELAYAVGNKLRTSSLANFVFDSLMMGVSMGMTSVLMALFVAGGLATGGLGAAGVRLGVGLWCVIKLLDVTGVLRVMCVWDFFVVLL